jgi:hypothetical protein
VPLEGAEPLLNPRYERFANEIANGVPALQAYSNAGFKYNTGNCYRLTKDERILKRVDAILAERRAIRNEGVVKAITEEMVTTQTILRELETARSLAERLERPGDFTRASLGKARVAGLLVERVDMRAQHEIVVSDMSDEQLLEAQARMLFGLCDGMGLNPDETSVTDLINAMMAAH